MHWDGAACSGDRTGGPSRLPRTPQELESSFPLPPPSPSEHPARVSTSVHALGSALSRLAVLLCAIFLALLVPALASEDGFASLSSLYGSDMAAPAPWVTAVDRASRRLASLSATPDAHWDASQHFAAPPSAGAAGNNGTGTVKGSRRRSRSSSAPAAGLALVPAAGEILATEATPPALDVSTIAMLQVVESAANAEELTMQVGIELMVEPLAVLGIPALVSIFIKVIRKLSFVLIAQIIIPSLLEPIIKPVVEYLAPLPATGGSLTAMDPIRYEGSSATAAPYREPVLGSPEYLDQLSQMHPAQEANDAERKAFGGSSEYLPPSQMMTDSALWSRFDRDRTGLVTNALLAEDFLAMAQWAELAQPRFWPGFVGTVDTADSAARVLFAVQVSGRPGMVKSEWLRDKHAMFRIMRELGAKYAATRKIKLETTPELREKWPMMSFTDFRHMQNDWQLLPLVSWRLLDPSEIHSADSHAVEAALRDLWARPDPALEDPKAANKPPRMMHPKMMLSPPGGFAFGRVYQACIIRAVNPTVQRVMRAFRSPDMPFPGVNQDDYFRNFNVFIGEAYRVKKECADKQALAGLGLPSPAGLGMTVAKDSDEPALWRRYVAAADWVRDRTGRVNGHGGPQGLPAEPRPEAAGDAISQADADKVTALSMDQVAAAVVLEAEPAPEALLAMSAGQARALWECNLSEAKRVFGPKVIGMYTGAQPRTPEGRAKALPRPTFATDARLIMTIGKGMRQVCMLRSAADAGGPGGKRDPKGDGRPPGMSDDQYIYVLWEIYTRGQSPINGFMSTPGVEQAMHGLLQKAAVQASPLTPLQHKTVHECLKRHIPGAAAQAVAGVLKHSRDRVKGAQFNPDAWLVMDNPAGTLASNGMPREPNERAVFLELEAAAAASAQAGAETEAEAEAEVDAEIYAEAEAGAETEVDADADAAIDADSDAFSLLDAGTVAAATAGAGAGAGAGAEGPMDAQIAKSRARRRARIAANERRTRTAAHQGLGVKTANYWQFYRGVWRFKSTVEGVAFLCVAPPLPPPRKADDQCPSRPVARPNESPTARERRLYAAREELRAAFYRFDAGNRGALSLPSFTSMLEAAAVAALNNKRLFPKVHDPSTRVSAKEMRVFHGCIKAGAQTGGRTLFTRYLRLEDPLALPLAPAASSAGGAADPLLEKDITWAPMRLEPTWFRHQVCAIVHGCTDWLNNPAATEDSTGITVAALLQQLWVRTLRVISHINRANARVLVTQEAKVRFLPAARALLRILVPDYLPARAATQDQGSRRAQGLMTSQYRVPGIALTRHHPGALPAAAAALASGAILDTYHTRLPRARKWATYDPELTYKIDKSRIDSILQSKLDAACTQRASAGEEGFDIARDQACRCARSRVGGAAAALLALLDKDGKGYVSAEDYFLTYTSPDAFDKKASGLLQACAARLARSSDDINAEYNSMCCPFNARNVELGFESKIDNMICSEPGWPHIARCMRPRAAKAATNAVLDILARDPKGSGGAAAQLAAGGSRGAAGLTVSKESFSANPYIVRDAFSAVHTQCVNAPEVRAAVAKDTVIWTRFAQDRDVITAVDVERVICERLGALVGVDASADESGSAAGGSLLQIGDGTVPHDSVSFLESGSSLVAHTTAGAAAVISTAAGAAAAAEADEALWLVRNRALTPSKRALSACISRNAWTASRKAIAVLDQSVSAPRATAKGQDKGRPLGAPKIHKVPGDGRITRCEFDANPLSLDESIGALFAQCGNSASDDAERVLRSYATPSHTGDPATIVVTAVALEERYNEMIEQARSAHGQRKAAAVERAQRQAYQRKHAGDDGRATSAADYDANVRAQALAQAQFEAVAECALDLTHKAASQVILGLVLHVDGVDALLAAAGPVGVIAARAGLGESVTDSDMPAEVEAKYVMKLAAAVGVDPRSPTLREALARHRRDSPSHAHGRGGLGHGNVGKLMVTARHIRRFPYALSAGAKAVLERCELATNARVHRLWARYAPTLAAWEEAKEMERVAAAEAEASGATAAAATRVSAGAWLSQATVDDDFDSEVEEEEHINFVPRQVIEEMIDRMLARASERRVGIDEDSAVAEAAARDAQQRAETGPAASATAGSGASPSLVEVGASSTAVPDVSAVPGYAVFARCVRQGVPAAADRVIAYFLPNGAPADARNPTGSKLHGAAREATLPQASGLAGGPGGPSGADTLLAAAAAKGRIDYRDWLRRQLGPLVISLDPPQPWGQSCPNLRGVFGASQSDSVRALAVTADNNDILAAATLAAAQDLARECDNKVNWRSLFSEVVHKILEKVVGGPAIAPQTRFLRYEREGVPPPTGDAARLHRIAPLDEIESVTAQDAWVPTDPVRGAGVEAAAAAARKRAKGRGASLLSVEEVESFSVDRRASGGLLGLKTRVSTGKGKGSSKKSGSKEASFVEVGSSLQVSTRAGPAPGLEAVTNDMGPLVQRVSEILGDAASTTLAAGLQATLPQNLVKVTNNTVSRVTARKLLKTLTVSLTDSLTATLLLAISRPLVHHTTRMLTHSLTPAIMYPTTSIVARALTHNPREDYYCWYCATTGQAPPAPEQKATPLYCDYCQHAQQYMHHIDHYAQYFARHYSSYYTEWYSQGVDVDKMIEMRDLSLEAILNATGKVPPEEYMEDLYPTKFDDENPDGSLKPETIQAMGNGPSR